MTTQELEKLLAEVTQGEWYTNTNDYGTSNTGGAYVGVYSEDGATITHVLCRDKAGTGGSHPYAPNARLIAMAPTLARRVIAAEKLVEALREAKSELESYELEMRGETYNSPMINAALDEWESLK